MRRLSAALVLICASAAALSACSSVNEAVKGPKLSPMNVPAALNEPMPGAAGGATLVSNRQPPPSASANSLWRSGARAFFIDQRASRVGDIVTVLIVIDDSAKTTNATASARTSTIQAGVPHLLGLEQSVLGKALPGAYDPANAISTNGATTNQGQGSVNRQEKINLTIAAVVTKILPNGNMMIQGSQEVRTNAEVRQLTVEGMVRPEDITATNTINHTQIAEARISYGGRGDISRVQKTPAGQSLFEKFSPF